MLNFSVLLIQVTGTQPFTYLL